jgi:murein L,D-transpeptidase YafK
VKRLALLKTYPILAASGTAGPKTREGDRQVPEGEYEIESLNPNSLYHLALRLNYPNEDDVEAAKSEGRTGLGGDIMIHGSDASVGCLAMGDPAIEELFVLVADTGLDKVSVLIAPWDFSRRPAPEDKREWVRNRYRTLRFMLYGLRGHREKKGSEGGD